MKKTVLLILILVLFIGKANAFSEDAYINIPKVNTIIGNDKFKVMRSSFTGVDGETEESGLKYFRKEHSVVLDSYNIKKYLITNREFSKFLNTSKYRTSYEKKTGVEYKQVLNNLDTPVKRITFFDAIAYCQWYSDITGNRYFHGGMKQKFYQALRQTALLEERTFPFIKFLKMFQNWGWPI